MTLVYPLLYYAFPQQLSLFFLPKLGFCSTSPLPTTATPLLLNRNQIYIAYVEALHYLTLS
jgi:hypothetical protein